MYNKENDNYSNWYSNNYDSNGDTEYFVKYISEKINSYEENINLSYIQIKNIMNKLEEEFPQIDINSFSEFFLICEEYYNLLQISKKCLNKLSESNQENERLNVKILTIKDKKKVLKSTNENLIEESKFKEDIIKKLEEDLRIMTKDYYDLSSKLNKNVNSESEPLTNTEAISNLVLELKSLTDEKTSLQRENLILSKNVERLENEIKFKFMPKNDFDKILNRLESEKTAYETKLKFSEINLEKIKRDVQFLKVDNDELKKDLQRSEKKILELTSSHNRIRTSEVYSSLENRGTPLNFMLGDEEDEDDFEGTKRNNNFFTKLQREPTKEIVTDFLVDPKNEEFSDKKINISNRNSLQSKIYPSKIKTIKEMDEEISEENEKELYKELDLNDGSNRSNSSDEIISRPKSKTCNLQLTSNEIVNRMKNNDFQAVKSLSTDNPKSEEKKNINIDHINISINKPPTDASRASRLITLKKTSENYDENMYKEFFNLTYQSLKLNSENIEPFLYVGLFKLVKCRKTLQIKYG
jgi:hypothetical protein